MDTNFSPTEYRYVSKNSRYLDPKRKALAKRTFSEEQPIADRKDLKTRLRTKYQQVLQFFKGMPS